MNYSGILKVLSVDEDGGANIWERRVVKVSSSPYSLSIFKKESEEIDIEISLTDADIQSIQADSSDYDAQSQDGMLFFSFSASFFVYLILFLLNLEPNKTHLQDLMIIHCP